jgi:hypothetical protein
MSFSKASIENQRSATGFDIFSVLLAIILFILVMSLSGLRIGSINTAEENQTDKSQA